MVRVNESGEIGTCAPVKLLGGGGEDCTCTPVLGGGGDGLK